MQEWLQYFLRGVEEQATDAVARAERLTELQTTYRNALIGDRSNAPHLIDMILANPLLTTGRVSRELDVTAAGTLNVIRKIEDLGWVEEFATSGRGGRII